MIVKVWQTDVTRHSLDAALTLRPCSWWRLSWFAIGERWEDEPNTDANDDPLPPRETLYVEGSGVHPQWLVSVPEGSDFEKKEDDGRIYLVVPAQTAKGVPRWHLPETLLHDARFQLHGLEVVGGPERIIGKYDRVPASRSPGGTEDRAPEHPEPDDARLHPDRGPDRGRQGDAVQGAAPGPRSGFTPDSFRQAVDGAGQLGRDRSAVPAEPGDDELQPSRPARRTRRHRQAPTLFDMDDRAGGQETENRIPKGKGKRKPQ